jgi:hypothetical protein
MKKIGGLIICVTLLVAGMLVGFFVYDGQRSAEGSVPIQITDPAGWRVSNFLNIQLNELWSAPFLQDDCGNISSRARVGEPALVLVRTETEDVLLEYPNVGSRLTACAGFTAYFPPASSGIPPRDPESR